MMRYLILIALLLCLPVRGEAWQVVGGGDKKTSVSDSFDYTSGQTLVNANPDDWGDITDIASITVSTLNGIRGPGKVLSGAKWVGDTFNADQKACLKVQYDASYIGVAVRIQPSVHSLYRFGSSGGATTSVAKDISGVETVLATYGDVVSGDTICLSAQGTILTPYINGAPQATVDVSGSDFLSSGQPGVFFYSPDPFGDDFTAVDL